MAQAISQPKGDGKHSSVGQLGPLLCWAVVFADIGSSIYYVPGILYGRVGNLAGFFVLLTMSVFVLLTLKYAEVSARFPEGGGVVSVAAQAINSWVGALGGMFILVSYFLTAAISCLSAVQYFSVVFPAIGPVILEITICILVLLGVLNWVGISESAKVSLVGALIAFVSDLVIIWTVFTHVPVAEFPSLFASMFAHASLTPTSILVGFAGSFLAFSGLESISQLSPSMKTPRKKIISLALLFVVITIGVTSPLLTILATLLQQDAAANPVLSTQLLSLLGGHWGNLVLQTEVAISASLILAFASNTALIGAYHVFLALARMEFFPEFILRRNRFRGTPHWSIALATGIPIAVLLLVHGEINILGDMYAFGLLGAFTVTCIGLDIIRYRERKTAQADLLSQQRRNHDAGRNGSIIKGGRFQNFSVSKSRLLLSLFNGHSASLDGTVPANFSLFRNKIAVVWREFDFWLGVLTTLLVVLAWSISIVSQPLATVFGCSVAFAGMGVAYVNYRQGRAPMVTLYLDRRMPDSLLAVLVAGDEHNDAVIDAAINHARGKPVVFLYLAQPRAKRVPQLFEVVDPYLEDGPAKATLKQAALLARKAGLASRFVYRPQGTGSAEHIWQTVHPRDVVLTAEHATQIGEINPDRIRYELTPHGKIAHLLKSW
ncbi:MAG TPA: APC family permease [Ktedonobacteraceae bacterium]|nr:APC family permease [Ktedonobacteraceae bacterium]